MTIGDILVLGLATWRIAKILLVESGPFGIFIKVRTQIGIQHDEYEAPYAYPDTFLGQLFSCMWCFSMWCGLILSSIYYLCPLSIYIMLPFALSSISIIVDDDFGN